MDLWAAATAISNFCVSCERSSCLLVMCEFRTTGGHVVHRNWKHLFPISVSKAFVFKEDSRVRGGDSVVQRLALLYLQLEGCRFDSPHVWSLRVRCNSTFAPRQLRHEGPENAEDRVGVAPMLMESVHCEGRHPAR